ncbi:LysR family transcriptional regulator [Roseibium sp.]|uniref:LysR family transcriptional regulator n=1 Tax=Roseibium sp. TaxID=1936156 RepID=UPI003D0C806C
MSSALRGIFNCSNCTGRQMPLVSALTLCCSTKMKSEFRNWSDVRIFLAVFREGSTLAASRKLDIAQPTVARRIDALEHELKTVLFERDTRGFKPTQTARTLYPLAETMEIAARAFADKTGELTSARPIRITAYSGNFSPKANDIFSAFSAEHPDVRFEFLPGVKVLDLTAGEADVALRITRQQPAPELICRKISTARYALYGSTAYAEKHGLPASVNELEGHTFVSFERQDVPRYLHDWLLKHVAREQILLTFSEVELMHAAVRSGHGLGLMNLRMADAETDLLRCFDPIEELSAEHMMLVSPEAYRRPEVKAFTKFFAPRYAALYK